MEILAELIHPIESAIKRVSIQGERKVLHCQNFDKSISALKRNGKIVDVIYNDFSKRFFNTAEIVFPEKLMDDGDSIKISRAILIGDQLSPGYTSDAFQGEFSGSLYADTLVNDINTLIGIINYVIKECKEPVIFAYDGQKNTQPEDKILASKLHYDLMRALCGINAAENLSIRIGTSTIDLALPDLKIPALKDSSKVIPKIMTIVDIDEDEKQLIVDVTIKKDKIRSGIIICTDKQWEVLRHETGSKLKAGFITQRKKISFRNDRPLAYYVFSTFEIIR